MKRPAGRSPAAPHDPIYYQELAFSNLKCFAGEHRIDFRGPDGQPSLWNLLLGENGVGKTTILQMLAWMRPAPPPDAMSGIEPALLGEADNTLFIKLVRQGDAATELAVTATFAARGATTSVAAAPVQTGIVVTTAAGDFTNYKEKLKDVRLGPSSPPPAPELPVIAYSANRQIGALNLADATVEDPVSTLFSNTTILYDPEAILKDLDYAASRGVPGAQARLDLFLDLVATIAPQIGRRENIRFLGPSITADRRATTGVLFYNCFGWVGFSDMSLGQQTTVAWALDLAWRLVRLYPNSPNPLAEPAIVLVDEIDLHLHPRWQQDLRGYLAAHFPATQFIATAHSPLMAQASLDANVAVFQNHNGQLSIWNDAERLTDWRLDQVVTALFGLGSARGPAVQKLLDERDALLRLHVRDTEQQARLDVLQEQIQDLPVPTSAMDPDALAIIRRAALRINGT